MQKHALIKDSLTMAIIQTDGYPDLYQILKIFAYYHYDSSKFLGVWYFSVLLYKL